MIVDKGMLKVAKVVEGVCLHMQSQRVPGKKVIIFKRSTIDIIVPHPSINLLLTAINISHRGLSFRTGSTFSSASRDWD